MKKRILVVSSANMDLVMDAPRVPVAGETVICKGSYKYVPGGKGANSAVAFSRLGAECVFCARLGADGNGDVLSAVYNKEGIDTSHVVRDAEAPTGLAAIMVGADGNNRIMVYPGANMKIDDAQVSAAVERGADALYMQLEISCDAVVLAANAASRAGIPVFIDAGPADPAFPFDKLPELEVFSPNESETEILTGIFPEDEGKCAEAARKLAELVRARCYVIKLGARGCYVTDLDRGFSVAPFETRAVDTTAAGDAFTAALTLEYLRTGDMKKAAKYANAVGALTVSRSGAIPSIPTSDEVNKLIG